MKKLYYLSEYYFRVFFDVKQRIFFFAVSVLAGMLPALFSDVLSVSHAELDLNFNFFADKAAYFSYCIIPLFLGLIICTIANIALFSSHKNGVDFIPLVNNYSRLRVFGAKTLAVMYFSSLVVFLYFISMQLFCIGFGLAIFNYVALRMMLRVSYNFIVFLSWAILLFSLTKLSFIGFLPPISAFVFALIEYPFFQKILNFFLPVFPISVEIKDNYLIYVLDIKPEFGIVWTLLMPFLLLWISYLIYRRQDQ
jgi:hypothetical protein